MNGKNYLELGKVKRTKNIIHLKPLSKRYQKKTILSSMIVA